MIINNRLKKNFLELKESVDSIVSNVSITDFQIESFLKKFEKTRYNILSEIKTYNKNAEFDYEKIKTIDNCYTAYFDDGVLQIYIPDVLPSYKNLKTQTQKRILLNVAEVTKPYAFSFGDEVFIYIKVCDNISGWDIDNKYIKPISDALIMSEVIKDDNISKMFYAAKGEYSDIPHTEVYVFNSKEIEKFLSKFVSNSREKIN